MRFLLFLGGFLLFTQPQWASGETLSTTDKIVNKFMALDLDESETVSYEEYKTMVMQRLDERFRLMDANEDGEIDEEEYRSFWTETKSQYYRPRRE